MSEGIPLAEAFVRIRADGREFKAESHRLIEEVAHSSDLAGIGRVMGGTLLGGIGVALAGGALVAKTGLEEYSKSSALNAQFTAGIKSTANAAHLSVAGMDSLASSIAAYSGQTYASIGTSEQLLQTFTNIRNVGPNKIFDLATEASANMAAKLGGDASQSSIKLGIALNDPVKGIAKLARVGVMFTQSQKDSIKTLMKHGDIMGAQKVILRELSTEFGGAAKAAGQSLPGQVNRAKVAFGELSKGIVEAGVPLVTAFLPVMSKVTGFLTTTAAPAVKTFFEQMSSGKGAGGAVVKVFKDIWGAVQPIGSFLTGTVIPAVKGFFTSFSEGGGPGKIQTLFATLVTFFETKVVPGFMSIVNTVQTFVSVATPIVGAFVAGMMARIGPMMPQIRSIFTQIGSVITSVMGLIQAVISRVTVVISFIWAHWGNQIMDFVAAMWKTILQVISGALTVIQGVISLFTDLFKGKWGKLWGDIETILSGAWTIIKGVLAQGWLILQTVSAAAWDAIKAATAAAWNGMKTLFHDAIAWIVGKFLDFAGTIIHTAATAFSWVPGLGDKLRAAQSQFDTFRDGVNASLAGIKAPPPITITPIFGPSAPGSGGPGTLAGQMGFSSASSHTVTYNQPVNNYGPIHTTSSSDLLAQAARNRRMAMLGGQ